MFLRCCLERLPSYPAASWPLFVARPLIYHQRLNINGEEGRRKKRGRQKTSSTSCFHHVTCNKYCTYVDMWNELVGAANAAATGRAVDSSPDG